MVFVLEILGLGLGVAPLVIELLKANPEPIHTMKAIRSEAAKDMMEDFYLNLAFEMSMLKLTLAGLVQELPIDEDLKASLIHPTNLDTGIWKNPPQQLQLSLERRLSPCLETFQKCMERILYQLSKLVKDNSLPVPLPSDQVRSNTGKSYAKLEEFFRSGLPAAQRLKFAWRKDKRDKLISSISKYNGKLQDMLERTSSHAPSTMSHQPKQDVGCVPHLGFRQRMTELCQAMGRVWCKCTGYHEMRFGLSKAEIHEAHITLDMLMNLSKDEQKYQWGESKMKIRLQTDSPTPRPADSTFASRHSLTERRRRSSTFTGSTLVASPEGSPRTESPGMSARFGSPLNPMQAQAYMNQSRTAAEDTKPYPDAAQVDVICEAVRNGHRKRRASQITFHDDELWCHSKFTEPGVSHTHPGISLTDYILDKRWTMEDRKVLQVLLAQSILFYPWKGAELSKDAIAFHHDPPRRPFASFKPERGGESPQIFPEADDIDSGFQPYQNETLAALATILLEVEMQKRIEDMTIEEDIADDDPKSFLTRFWTTSRVLQEQRYNMYQGCYDSIDACIRCDFVEGSANLDDTTFLEKVYERIVNPLENELWNGFRIKLPIAEAAPSVAQQSTATRIVGQVNHVSRDVPILSTVPSPGTSMFKSDVTQHVTMLDSKPSKQVQVAVKMDVPATSTTV